MQVFVDGLAHSTWQHRDTLELTTQTNKYINDLWNEGHLFAGVDSIKQRSIFLHKGKKFEFHNQTSKGLSLAELLAKANDEISAKINNGFPFARLSWDSIRLNDDRLSFRRMIELGPFVENDSIVLLSPIRTKRDFIAKVLDIEEGVPFNERTFSSIPNRMRRIPFMELRKQPDISFQDGKAWMYLDLEERKTGSFEGVLGVLPNQSSQQKALITGSLDLSLLNLFQRGRELDFFWQRFGEESQKLNLRYKHPFIAGSSLHFEGNFGLLKQDTSFINQELGLTASRFLKDHLEMGLSFEQENGDVLTTNQSNIIARNYLDFQQNLYSASLTSSIGNITLAKNGFNYKLKVGIGERIVSINPNLPMERYDTIDLEVTNLQLETNTEFQLMLNERVAFHSNLSLAHRTNSQSIGNQLYRLGGLKTLRGFNEQFFFASSYLVSQFEGRFYFEEESFLFAFYDQGILRARDWQTPIGLGGGFSLRTNSGLFSFAMAVGKTKSIPFEFANAKVHFGYLSRF